MEMDADTGQGWSEILRMHNGLCVAFSDYRLNHRLETCHTNMQTPFQLYIRLSGRFDYQLPNQAKEQIAAGEIWCIHGSFEQVAFSQFPDKEIRAVSICLPQDFIEYWLGSSCCAASNNLEKLAFGGSGASMSGQYIPLVKKLHYSSVFMRIARELVYARRQTLADKLRFESLALDLLSRVLNLEDPAAGYCGERARKITAIVDEAADILRQEWNNPPNISSLARRVGVNESYLKEWFRQRMETTIGAYIRQQRMTKAREMIETGEYSILQTAVFVGYSNPSCFSAAFKKFYGHLPSYYLPRSGKTPCQTFSV